MSGANPERVDAEALVRYLLMDGREHGAEQVRRLAAERDAAERERDELARPVPEHPARRVSAIQLAALIREDKSVGQYQGHYASRVEALGDERDRAEREVGRLRRELDELAEALEQADKAIRWALGEEGEFRPPPDGKRYWWRGTLRRLAGLEFGRGRGRSFRALLDRRRGGEAKP